MWQSRLNGCDWKRYFVRLHIWKKNNACLSSADNAEIYVHFDREYMKVWLKKN